MDVTSCQSPFIIPALQYIKRIILPPKLCVNKGGKNINKYLFSFPPFEDMFKSFISTIFRSGACSGLMLEQNVSLKCFTITNSYWRKERAASSEFRDGRYGLTAPSSSPERVCETMRPWKERGPGLRPAATMS